MAKRRFTEELSFETELAQAAACPLSLYVKSKDRREALMSSESTSDGLKVIETGTAMRFSGLVRTII